MVSDDATCSIRRKDSVYMHKLYVDKTSLKAFSLNAVQCVDYESMMSFDSRRHLVRELDRNAVLSLPPLEPVFVLGSGLESVVLHSSSCPVSIGLFQLLEQLRCRTLRCAML